MKLKSLLPACATGFLLLPPAGAQDLRPVPEFKNGLESEPTTKRSDFVIVEDLQAIDRFNSNPVRVRQAFNAALLTWTGKSNLSDAWRSLVDPGDRVGIRINARGGAMAGTDPALVQAVVDGLREAGIRAEDIVVWDKYPHHMIASGFVPMAPKQQWQCKSVVDGAGWDPEVFYFHETVGRLIWGDHEFVGSALPKIESPEKEPIKPEPLPGSDSEEQISNRSYFNRIVTQQVDKLINLPAMTSHPGTGIQGCLASLALGSVDNHRRFLDGSNPSATAIAELYARPEIQDRIVLHIVDGLVMQYAGGPDFDPNHALSSGLILIGQDPVAIDSWMLQQMEFQREDHQVVNIGEKAKHIKAARAFGLGEHFENVEITRIGPQD